MKNILSQKVREAVRALLQYRVVVWLKKRFPRFFYFLIYRFNTTTFAGLPLTLLVLVFLLNALLLSELAEEVVESDGAIVLDERLTHTLFSRRSDWLSHTFYIITHMGSKTAVIVIGLVITAVFLYRRRYTAVLAFWLMAAGAGLSVRYGKIFVNRDRPANVAYYQEKFYSFPSGHATTASAIYGFLGYLLFRHYNRRPYRNIILWGTPAVVVLIGFSRVYLGVHYLTDVLAGFMLGGMWLLVGISLMEVMLYRKALRTNGEQRII